MKLLIKIQKFKCVTFGMPTGNVNWFEVQPIENIHLVLTGISWNSQLVSIGTNWKYSTGFN